MTANGSNPRYASVHRRASWVIAFFVVLIVSTMLAATIDIWAISLLSRCQAGTACTLEEAQLLDLSSVILRLVDLGAQLTAAIMFLVWLHAAYKYVISVDGALLQYSPGWAVAWWFVPFLSLWMPYQVVRDLWEASLPPAGSNPTQAPESLAVLRWWWAAYLISHVVSNIDTRVYDAANTANELISASWVSLISAVITIVAALVTIDVVRTIDRNQAIGHGPTATSYEVPLRSAPAY